VKLRPPRLGSALRGAGSRRRKPVRSDGPRTIIPVDIEPERAPPPPPAGLLADLDAARARLRRTIPPVDDER
jgi:hypothetical protein